MVHVWAENQQNHLKVLSPHLVWFARRILEELSLGSASASILVMDDEGIRALNRRYLNRDRPTNVISFPMREGETISGDASYLGDVAISAETALREGMEYNYSPEEMLLLYLIHGLLHLSGYNHEGVEDAEAERMEMKQAAMFEALAPFLVEYPLVVTDAS